MPPNSAARGAARPKGRFGAVARDALPATGSVSVGVAAPPSALWALVSDPSTPARFSPELDAAGFVDAGAACVGAEIEGRNSRGTTSWSTRSTVVACDAPERFAWSTGDVAAPAATWTFDVAARGEGSTLTHRVELHADVAPLGAAIAEEPERAEAIVAARMADVLEGMRLVAEGVAAAAEAAGGAATSSS
jgi:Polyketide cyclase / dehydrase and lipid transport